MIFNVPSSSKHRLRYDSCMRSVMGQCMMNWQLGSADSKCCEVEEGASALGWNGFGRPLKDSELSELQQKPNSIRTATGKSLIIIQIQARLRRIRNIKYRKERRKENAMSAIWFLKHTKNIK